MIAWQPRRRREAKSSFAADLRELTGVLIALAGVFVLAFLIGAAGRGLMFLLTGAR